MKRQDLLETIEHAEHEYGSLVTNRLVTRRDVMRLIRAGLAKWTTKPVETLDEHHRPTGRRAFGVKLTKAGKRYLRPSSP